MDKQHRVLVTAHGHPDFSIGGAEVAAFNLYNAYKANSLVEDAWFLARVDQRRSVDGSLRPYRGNEYMWEQSIGDWHFMKAAHQESLTTSFASLIHAIRPTVVHVHHYVHLGLEHLRVIKNIDPTIKIIMTLHEFIAICKHNGQMINKGTLSLCQTETYDACCRCFPEHTIEEFWLRKKFFLNHFKLIDQFVSPSEFLRQRYIQWGLPPDKIAVIENGHADALPLPPRSLEEGETRNRFGFFGQINPYKGLDIILQALCDLPKSTRRKLVLEINGANLEGQSHKFRAKIQSLSRPLERDDVIQWRGPYERNQLADRMATIDWVVVPSIWWENSPMVIQEAFVFGRPLLVSDIGGMAEKVRNGVNGLNVRMGDCAAWGTALVEAASDHDLWAKLRAGITKPITYSECADAHLRLIECGLDEKGLREAHHPGAQYLH
jgi:glycosyltransferase involved in cell wall biosynthesis